MNLQANNHCSRCGLDITQAQTHRDTKLCPKCGHALDSIQQDVSQPPKTGPMSQHQLILMMILLPLLVVAMTVGSWYIIKAYRLPSVDVETPSSLIHSD
ncbi:MAG: hypothetical protein DWP95_03265 [Proteobacteria bacterium]|nr:MAG: hypothetical protein DWP95_03265 [Pseudomonadota bacterium]